MTPIDLNCDLGESPERIADGTDEALMALITSASIACGGHAGDERTMDASVRSALRNGVAIGAHPSYPDPASFGRRELAMSIEQLAGSITRQVETLAGVAARLGAGLAHVKAHGALYHRIADGGEVAEAFAIAIARVDPGLILFGLAGSRALVTWESLGRRVAAEAFADRRYEADGGLRSRAHADALLTEPADAAEQAARIARGDGVLAHDASVVPLRARSLCVHGDTAGAVAIVGAVRERLEAEGMRVAAP